MEALRPDDPARIGPFTPVARIGSGGMGRVYLARSRGGRPVAVKVVRGEYAEDGSFRTRFRREVEAARTVGGLYTATVLDAGPDDDQPWLATAYIPGPSLQQLIGENGPLPERSARILGGGIAEALGAIHAAGLIHRDLKPSNVICGPDGPRVIDFGISHAIGGTSLTATGLVVGSPRYASPEQCRADAEAGPASDVFALGGVLVYATTGMPPFGDGPDHVQLYLVVHEEPDLAGVPAGLRPIVAACLAKDPADRPSIDQLLDTLLPEPAAGGFVDTGEDWLPAAAGSLLRTYAVAGANTSPMVERGEVTAETASEGAASAGAAGRGAQAAAGAGAAAGYQGSSDGMTTGQPSVPAGRASAGTPAGVSATHLRPEYDPVHGAVGPGPAAPTTVPAATAPPPSAASPTRRRVLTGAVGLAAMAASGGAAWWAATRNGSSHAAAPPAATPTDATTPPPTTIATTAPTTPATSASTSGSPDGHLYSVPVDLTYGRGALVAAGRLVGVHQNSVSQNAPLLMIALATDSGKQAWQQQLPPANPAGSFPLAADAANVYSYSGGIVTAWRLSDGTKAWDLHTGLPVPTGDGGGIPDSSVIGMLGGVLFVGVQQPDPGKLTVLVGVDVAKQKVVWSHTGDDLRAGLPAGLAPGDVTVVITVPAAGPYAYLSLSDSVSARQVKALSPATGKEVWSAPFTHRSVNMAPQMYPTITGTEDMVFLTDMHSGYLHAYDVAGKWKWTYPKSTSPDAANTPAPSRFTGRVAIANGVVYACDTTTVHAFDATTGQAVPGWTKPASFPAGLRGYPVAAGGLVWGEADTPAASPGPLTLFALDPATGQPSKQIGLTATPASTDPDTLVADQDTLYVVSTSGEVSAYRAGA